MSPVDNVHRVFGDTGLQAMPGSDNDRLWQRAWRYIRANQAAPARAVLESILTRDPGDVRAHVCLAGVYASQDRPRAAAGHIRDAAVAAPNDPALALEVAGAAVRAGEIVIARTLLSGVRISAQASPELLMSAAVLRQLIGDNAAALADIESARRVGATGTSFHFYRATQLGFKGDFAGAESEFERCIVRDPPLGHAFLQLALLRKQTLRRNHLPAIEAALARVDPNSEDAAALQFAHYRVLEDLGRYEDAWGALNRGNALVRARAPYDASREEALFGALLNVCTRPFLADGVLREGDGPQPIFVIGMPRSGTTLLERILGNHSRVESAGEFGAFAQALTLAIDHQVPAAMPDATTVARLAGAGWAAVTRRYLAQSQWRARGKPFYVDKLPRNWMLAGLIHKAFPRAPILNLVRAPMDVCFSNWRAYLGDGPEYGYAYGLDALAAHHRQYRRVLAYWHAAMPRAILDVDYARLVREPEAVAQEVLAFCGLAYEPGLTDLARNEAPSATLSSAQVRGAVRAPSACAWVPYAARLSELSAALAREPGRRGDVWKG